MLDIQFIRDNPDLVKQKSAQKNEKVDIDRLLEVDKKQRELVDKVNKLREQRNSKSLLGADQKPTAEQIEAGKKIKYELNKLESALEPLEQELQQLLRAVPNMPLDHVPIGKSENDNVVTRTEGQKPVFDFAPKNHWELTEPRGLIDKQRAAKVAGSRFAYIKGGLVELQMAIMQWVVQTLTDEKIIAKIIKDNGLNLQPKPFIPVLPPALVNTKAYQATGRLNAEEVTYKLADDEMWLNASAEHSMCNMYMDEILPAAELPIRYLAYSTSFRREAGTYGKDTEGIIRLHQFDKLEMEVFSTCETGLEEHKLLIAIQEYLVKQIGLHYQVLEKCTADIGKPNAAGVDIEVWVPGQNKFRETHTADYMTDYQARSLKTRVKTADGKVQYLHTNDATAFALGRIMVAIIENYQTKDGHIKIPKALLPYMPGKEQI